MALRHTACGAGCLSSRMLVAAILSGCLSHQARSVNHGAVSCVMDLGTEGSVHAPSGHDATVTVESWIKITGASGLGAPWIGNSHSTDKNWGIYFGQTRMYVAMIGGPSYAYAGASPADGEWHHVALAGDKLYVDGQLSASGITNGFQTGTADDMWIGNYAGRFKCCGMGGSVQIHDFRVWSTEHTAESIAAEVDICNLDLGTAGLENVLAYGNSLTDLADQEADWIPDSVDYQCPTESSCPPPDVFPDFEEQESQESTPTPDVFPDNDEEQESQESNNDEEQKSQESMPTSVAAALQQGASSRAVQGLSGAWPPAAAPELNAVPPRAGASTTAAAVAIAGCAGLALFVAVSRRSAASATTEGQACFAEHLVDAQGAGNIDRASAAEEAPALGVDSLEA